MQATTASSMELGARGRLALLCAINLLVYADRGIISSNGPWGGATAALVGPAGVD